jgi:hypothetical protein
MFKNMLLRRIFGPQTEEVVGGSRKPHNEQLHNLYGSTNFIRATKSSRMIWARLVARMVEIRNSYIWLENLKGRDHLEDPGVDGKIILEWMLGKWTGRMWRD